MAIHWMALPCCARCCTVEGASRRTLHTLLAANGAHRMEKQVLCMPDIIGKGSQCIQGKHVLIVRMGQLSGYSISAGAAQCHHETKKIKYESKREKRGGREQSRESRTGRQ